MNDIDSIDRAIAALEAQRGVLGDAVVDTALAPLAEKRAALVERIGSARRKQVTVLFSDLVDFTVLSRSLDAEDVRALINPYFERWREHIEAHGGIVEKFIGDAVMAVFGLHQAQEDDPHRAIRAAIAMRDDLDAFNDEVAGRFGVAINMRVGIDTGEVVVSSLDERSGQDFVVVGETVNRASRLQGAAPPGGILIAGDTHRLVRGQFSFESMPHLRLKGIDEPVDAFLVRTERPQGFGLDEARGVEGLETKTIGRDVELQRLQNYFWDVLEERRWRVVTVTGDPGVGKSRLLYEFDRWLAEITQPVWWFRGRSAPASLNLPNSLLRDVIAARVGIHDSDGGAVVRQKLEDGFEAAFDSPETAVRKAHLTGHWLGFEIGESPHVAALKHDPQGSRERASTHLAEYFQHLTEWAPLVLLLEDLHWADDGSLAWLDDANAILQSSPVLVVGTARPALFERHPRWGEGLGHHERVSLEPLSRRDSRRLLDEIMQLADHVPAALTDLVIGTAEGNPFHLEELVKWLLEHGVIINDGTSWRVDESRIVSITIPSTLKGVLQARLDALPMPEQVVVQRASVVGRVFWDETVKSLGQEPPTVVPIDDALDRLRAREVVYQRPNSAFDATREFTFKHAVLRDVAYDSVLRADRHTYHGLAARWLVQMTERSDRADEYAGLIAEHFDLAGDVVPACQWYLRAGIQATSVHALKEATRLLGRALDIVPASEPVVRLDLLFAREVALDRLGDRQAQRRDLDAADRAVQDVDDPKRRVRVLLRWASWHFHHSEYADQVRICRQAVDLARRYGVPELATDGLLWCGMGLTWASQHIEAWDVLEESLESSRATGQRRLEGESLRYLSIVANNRSDFRASIDLLEQARTVHRANNDLDGETTVVVQLASVLYNLGRYGEARTYLEQALPYYEASGHRYRRSVVTANLGTTLVAQGYLGRARRLFEEGLVLSREVDDREGVAVVLGMLGDLYRRIGDADRSEPNLDESLAIAREIDSPFVISDTLLHLGFLASSRGDHDEAIRLTSEAVEEATRAESPLARARAEFGRGDFLFRAGRFEEAGEAFAAAGAESAEIELSDLPLEVAAGRARVALGKGDVEEARSLVESLLGHLDGPDLDGALLRGDVHLTCWRVLDRLDDPRAADVLRAGQNYVEHYAARIDEEPLREGFLRIPSHVELMAIGSTGHG